MSAEERQIGGLGIYLVRKSMDDIFYEYSEGKNILTIKKSYADVVDYCENIIYNVMSWCVGCKLSR